MLKTLRAIRAIQRVSIKGLEVQTEQATSEYRYNTKKNPQECPWRALYYPLLWARFQLKWRLRTNYWRTRMMISTFWCKRASKEAALPKQWLRVSSKVARCSSWRPPMDRGTWQGSLRNRTRQLNTTLMTSLMNLMVSPKRKNRSNLGRFPSRLGYQSLRNRLQLHTIRKTNTAFLLWRAN